VAGCRPACPRSGRRAALIWPSTSRRASQTNPGRVSQVSPPGPRSDLSRCEPPKTNPGRVSRNVPPHPSDTLPQFLPSELQITGMHVLPPGGPRTAYLVTVMVFVTVASVAPVPVLVNRPVMVTCVGVDTERVVTRNGALS
jgi:hypothetical protein